jgi:soluble lytic murein transglycosylase-like protein
MVIGLFGFASTANSKETIRTDTTAIDLEKQAIVKWIVTKTKRRVSYNKAARIVNTVYKNSDKTGVDPLIILGMITKESMFNPNAQSFYGAQGLMQVVPRYHRAALKKRSAFDIDVNIEVGSAYIKYCFQNRKTFNGAMNCYSGGAKNYASYVKERHKELKQVIVLELFNNNKHINVAYNSDKPISQPFTLIAGL